MKSTSKTVPLWLNIRKKSATHHPTGRWDCVCHGFHSPFHNKMASADALMSTRFICARSRVKPTTETKNNASKVIRVTLKSPTEAQSALGLMEPDQSYQLGFVRWATPGRFFGAERFASVAWGESRHIFAPADADARKHGWNTHSQDHLSGEEVCKEDTSEKGSTEEIAGEEESRREESSREEEVNQEASQIGFSRRACRQPMMNAPARGSPQQGSTRREFLVLWLEVKVMYAAGKMLWSPQSVPDKRLADDHFRRDIGKFAPLPGFDLPAHRLEVPLHSINANRDAVDERTTSSASRARGEGTSDNVSELTDRPQQNCHQKCGERKNHTKCPLSTRSVESAFGVRAAEPG